MHRSTFCHHWHRSIFVEICLVDAGIFVNFVSAVQSHPRSMNLVPIESVGSTSYQSVIVTLVLSCTVSELEHVLCAPIQPQFWGCPVAPDRRCWASASTWILSYLAVKLFSKNSNVFEHGTWSLRTDGQTDRWTTYCRITALCASIAQ